jgi:hypothetical protein
MVAVVGEARLEVAERIVGECGKMQDGIDPLEIGDLDVARILENCRHIADDAPLRERAALIEVAVRPITSCPAWSSMGVITVPMQPRCPVSKTRITPCLFGLGN